MSEVEDFAQWAREMSQRSRKNGTYGDSFDLGYYSQFTDEQIAAMGDDAFDEAVKAEAARRYPDYDPAKFNWSRTYPSDRDDCRECYKWRRFPPVQRHFGWAGWRECSHSCEHEHHRDEIWMAAPCLHARSAEFSVKGSAENSARAGGESQPTPGVACR